MSVRRVRSGDGSVLHNLRLAALHTDPLAFESTYAAEVDRPEELWSAWAAAAASGPDQAAFLAEVAGSCVGIAGGFRIDAEPAAYHLFSMWVSPEDSRQGHGGALLKR